MRIAATVLVAILLGAAGALKLLDPNAFALAIANYQILHRPLIGLPAYLLPPLELVVALALFSPRFRSAAWLLACLMFFTFAVGVGAAVARGLDVSCGCFGESMSVSWGHLAANLALAAISFWAFRQSESAKRDESSGERRRALAADAVFLTLLASLLGCSHHAARAQQPMFIPPANPAYAELGSIAAADLQARLGRPGVFVVDARPTEAFKKATIPTSRSIPLHSSVSQAAIDELRAANEIIIFCSGERCHASSQLAVELRARGVDGIRIFAGGLDQWRQMGFTVSGGKQP